MKTPQYIEREALWKVTKTETIPAITKLDYFASRISQALAVRVTQKYGSPDDALFHEIQIESVARDSFDIAAAMLAESIKRNKPE